MDLKNAYDAVVSAIADAQAVAQQIEALFAEGKTDEALALRDDFKTAQQKAEEIKSLYDDMAGVMSNDVAKKFVPAAKPKEEKEEAKVMSRAAFDKLDAKAKMAYIKADGKVVDDEQEA